MSAWFNIGTDSLGREYAVRAWVPGDGLFCSRSNRNAKTPCTAPVATLRTTRHNAWPTKETRHSVVCRNHVAKAVHDVTPGPSGDLNAQSEKAAKERVLAEHWDEYRAAFTAELAERRRQLWAALPEPLARAIQSDLESGRGES